MSGKEKKTENKEVIKKSFLKKFNFKAAKQKAMVGGLVATFGVVAVGTPVAVKYAYDQTEKTVTFKLDKISDKKTIVKENCTYEKITEYFAMNSSFFSFFGDDDSYESETVKTSDSTCSKEVLNREIHTEIGILKNDTSLLAWKEEEDVEVIDRKLKPDNWYEATVKGFTDSNIITLKRLPADWEQDINPAKKENTPSNKAEATKKVNTPDIEDLKRQLEILKLQKQLEDIRKKQQELSNSNDNNAKMLQAEPQKTEISAKKIAPPKP